VHALDRHGRRKGVGRAGLLEKLGRREDEDRPKALATGLHRVAHRGVEARRRLHRPGQEAVDASLDARNPELQR